MRGNDRSACALGLYGGPRVKKANEYREHAQECRQLARNAQNVGQRTQLLEMAQTWENLALERERLLREQEELDRYVELDEAKERNSLRQTRVPSLH
jgi:hypothetical protein